MKKFVGSTLVELMIAVIIIGILAYFSIPVYNLHILRENRIAAEYELLKTADTLEDYYADNATYRGATLKKLGLSEMIVNHHYQLVIETNTHHFTVSAIPQNAQQNDTQCGTLILNSVGKRDITGKGHAKDCW